MTSHEGYLITKTGFFKRSKRKYFILQGSTLIMKKSPNSTKIKHICELDKETLVNYYSSKDHDAISIMQGKKKYEFTSKDKEDLLRWLLDLRTVTFCTANLTMESFKIISVIGRGFFGKVMLVSMISTGQIFALKTIHKEKLIHSGRVKTVLAEREILGKINHPFIEKLEFAFQTPTKFYIGLEYISGGDLQSQIENHISKDDVPLYIAEIAIALQFLHSKGIIYRDLKPENILIAKDGHLKLVDFGLSKDISDSNTTKTFCGTADFLAPEIIVLKPYSYEVDWWTLGILLYELLYCKNPFHDDNKDRFYFNVTQGKLSFPDDADPVAVDLISHLLDRDMKKRYGFDQVMNHEFMSGLNENDVYNKKYTPHFVPELKNEEDVKYCDPECVNEPAVDSIATLPLGEDQRFQGFSYSNLTFD
ncbi:hypothetical protein M9Y10_009293 [Tritrichomonas musculus]|uniref:AGC family protein kinase n=1 Tax=Tritrichomonas musculus TaxID=1915356 RepID=A0ABR2IN66_9EUKA